MNARYYNANTGQFTSRDTYLGNAYNPQTHNLYSYTGNNPTSFVDPTGHAFFLVTALIGAVVGGAIGAYHSYKTTGKVTLKSVVKGALIGGAVGLTLGAGASLALTGGLAASGTAITSAAGGLIATGSSLMTTASQGNKLQAAANAVAQNAPTVEAIKSSIPTITAEIATSAQITGTSVTQQQLQNIATNANNNVTGFGTVPGTLKHSYFANQVRGLHNPNLRVEVSYMNGKEVKYGTPGSVRLDVVEYYDNGTIKAAYDLKTGKAGLTKKRIQEIRNGIGSDNVPVIEIRP